MADVDITMTNEVGMTIQLHTRVFSRTKEEYRVEIEGGFNAGVLAGAFLQNGIEVEARQYSFNVFHFFVDKKEFSRNLKMKEGDLP